MAAGKIPAAVMEGWIWSQDVQHKKEKDGRPFMEVSTYGIVLEKVIQGR